MAADEAEGVNGSGLLIKVSNIDVETNNLLLAIRVEGESAGTLFLLVVLLREVLLLLAGGQDLGDDLLEDGSDLLLHEDTEVTEVGESGFSDLQLVGLVLRQARQGELSELLQGSLVEVIAATGAGEFTNAHQGLALHVLVLTLVLVDNGAEDFEEAGLVGDDLLLRNSNGAGEGEEGPVADFSGEDVAVGEHDEGVHDVIEVNLDVVVEVLDKLVDSEESLLNGHLVLGLSHVLHHAHQARHDLLVLVKEVGHNVLGEPSNGLSGSLTDLEVVISHPINEEVNEGVKVILDHVEAGLGVSDLSEDRSGSGSLELISAGSELVEVLLENGEDLLVGEVASKSVEHGEGSIRRAGLVLVELRGVFAENSHSALDDGINEFNSVGLVHRASILLSNELKEQDSNFTQVDSEVLVGSDVYGLLGDLGQVGLEHLLDLDEFVESFEHLVYQVFVVLVHRVQHQGDQLVVLLQGLDSLGGLGQLVHSLDTQGHEAAHSRLEVALDDRVQLRVVVLHVFVGKVLDDHAQQNHGQFLVGELLALGRRHDEHEQVGPLLVGDKKRAEGADDVGDVLLDEGHGLLLESLEKQVLGESMLIGVEVGPELDDDLAKVEARNLSDLLVLMVAHEHQQVVEGLHLLEVGLQDFGCFLHSLSVRLEQFYEDVCEFFWCHYRVFK
mmetsp:Transcript_1414/g.1901  ORF Transcript_1414/g.1901 Transcript_1414/m.1901 type:complete len:670 (-) Transcript_1414:2-2011(-)